MNCKPGDLAWVVSEHPEYNGVLVEVLYATPSGNYTLPNGQAAFHEDNGEPSWVLRILSGPVPAPLKGGRWIKTIYGSGRDKKLRPIRGNPDDVEIETAVSEDPSDETNQCAS